jgi:hypothetical protein
VRLALILLLLTLRPAPAAAETRETTPAPLLLLAPGLTGEALLEALEQPRWAKLRDQAAVALLNVNTAGPHTAAASRATILLGRRVREAQPASGPAGVRVVELPDGDPEAALAQAEAAAGPGALVVLAGPDPGAPVRNSRTRLGAVLALGLASAAPGRGPHWATSATTRTAGLVASVDLAPTLLAHQGLPRPPEMEGRPLRVLPPRPVADLRAWARHAAATHALMTPGLLAWGGWSFAAVLTCVLAVGGSAARQQGARALLTGALAAAPAMLLAAAWPAPGAAALALRWLGLATGLTAAALGLGRRVSPILTLLAVTTALALADLLLDLGMLPRNLMSDFPNVGARFYGIGNEWEGLLLAATALLPFWLQQGSGAAAGTALLSLRTRALAVVLWGTTLIAVGLPPFGADFGGAVTFALAYGLAGAVFAAPGVPLPVRARRLAGAVAAAAAVVAAIVAFDLSRPPESRTHIGGFAARALAGEWRPVLDLIGRKLALNLEMARSGYFLLGLAAAAPLVLLLRRRLGGELRVWRAREPVTAAGIQAVLAGGLLGLVLNDTGVVTWGLCTGAALTVVLDRLLGPEGDPAPASTPASSGT